MKHVKSALILLFCVFVTFSGWAEGQKESAGKAKPVEMKMATVHPETYPNGLACKKFAEMVEEATDGRVKITVYYSGELGDQKSYIEQCQMGTLDFADTSASPMENFVPDLGVLSMPYLYKNREHKWRVFTSDVGKELLATCEDAKLYGISYYEAGARSYYAKTPIRKLEDLQGLKIRVMQSQVCIDQVNAMGASAVPMAFSEIYSALQSGVIDGNECNHPTYLTHSHYELCPYFTFDRHVMIPDMVIASKKSLDKLSDEDKETIFEVGDELWKYQLEYYEANEDKAYDTLVEKGITFITLSDAEMQRFRDSVKPVYEKYDKKFGKWISKIKSIE